VLGLVGFVFGGIEGDVHAQLLYVQKLSLAARGRVKVDAAPGLSLSCA